MKNINATTSRATITGGANSRAGISSRTANTKTVNTKRANSKPDAEVAWKQFEDHLIPTLRLSAIDRAVYSHLFRHSRLEGKRQLHFSILGLARSLRLSTTPVPDSIRRLMAYGVLRLVKRSVAGHTVGVRMPQEVRLVRAAGLEVVEAAPARGLEETDFLAGRDLRKAIHARECGLCFYCRKRLKSMAKCLDHVVPRVRAGLNSYRNLVSCCLECNLQKGQKSAPDFVRWLYREQRLTAMELRVVLRKLDALAAGKLVPRLP